MANGPTWIWIKEGAIVRYICKEIRKAKGIAYRVYARYGLDLYITSGGEGNHREDSIHYVDNAIDIRWPRDSNLIDPIHLDLKKDLGKDYDIVKNNTYKIFHIEFDPK